MLHGNKHGRTEVDAHRLNNYGLYNKKKNEAGDLRRPMVSAKDIGQVERPSEEGRRDTVVHTGYPGIRYTVQNLWIQVRFVHCCNSTVTNCNCTCTVTVN